MTNNLMKSAAEKIESHLIKDHEYVGGVSKKMFFKVNGQKYMLKGDTNYETIMEVFAYRLGKKLNLNVLPTFYIENSLDEFGNTEILSVHKWYEDFSRATEIFDYEDEKIIDYFGDEGVRCLLFDGLINNGDRHGGNLGTLESMPGKLALIDHGLARAWRGSELIATSQLRGGFRLSKLITGEKTHNTVMEFLELMDSVVNDIELEKMLSDMRKYDRSDYINKIKFNIIETVKYIKNEVELFT